METFIEKLTLCLIMKNAFLKINFLASTITRTDMLLNAIVVKLDQGKNGMDLVLKEVGIMTQGEWEMAVEEVA